MSWNQSEWASSLLSSAALLALVLTVADPIEPAIAHAGFAPVDLVAPNAVAGQPLDATLDEPPSGLEPVDADE